jgi:GNAT superfamily N-acetyltransferase
MILNNLLIRRIEQIEVGQFSELLIESLQQQQKFIKRLMDEYQHGINRFDRPGEILMAAYLTDNCGMKDRLIGICGLNIDPFLNDETVGRVRHLYVLSAYRRQKIARQLMAKIVEHAGNYFKLLTLRTDSVEADRFYRAVGFQPTTNIQQATHYKEVASERVKR